MDPNTGQITGTPTTGGTSNITIKVTDTANSLSGSLTLPINILEISSTSLPGALAGSLYSASPTAAGDPGVGLTWTASGLPAGLSINTFTGPDHGHTGERR